MWTPETRVGHARDDLRYPSDLTDEEWQVLAPSGHRPGMPCLTSPNNNMKGSGPELWARRPDITMAVVDAFLTNRYRARADFVYAVTRDFVRRCQTPILVLPDDVPGHPYVVAMETVHLTPNAPVSRYPWKDTKDKIPLAVRHIHTFPRAHRPVAGTQSTAAAAQYRGPLHNPTFPAGLELLSLARRT